MSQATAKSKLQVSVRVGAARVEIEYTFTNHDETPLGLWNRLSVVSPDGATSRIDPNAVYVDLDGSTLHVQKQVLPIPPGLKAAERIVPYLSKVDPGASFHEVIALDSPVKVDQLYRRALLQAKAPSGHRIAATRPAQATSLTFSLGVSTLGSERLIEVEPKVYRVWPPGPVVDRQIVISETIALAQPIAVLDYA